LSRKNTIIVLNNDTSLLSVAYLCASMGGASEASIVGAALTEMMTNATLLLLIFNDLNLAVC
jgi:hypothetical protein